MIFRGLSLTIAAIVMASPALAISAGPAPEIDASIAGGIMLTVAAIFAARRRKR